MKTISSNDPLDFKTYDSLFRGDELLLLNSIDKPFTTFGREAQKEALRFLDNIGDFQKLISLRNHERLRFCYKHTISGKHPRKCYPFQTLKDKSKSSEFIQEFSCSRLDVKEKSFAPKKSVEDIFGIAKDPETLDDSDMGSLLDDDEQEDKMEKFIRKNKNLEMYCSYLLATRNSLYLAGGSTPTKIFDGIADCEIFDTLPGTVESFALITTNSGYLYTVCMSDAGRRALCIQSWYLGCEGTWFIIKHSPTNEFVVINKDKGICKFFAFQTFTHFELINNLIIDNATILDCIFMPNRSNSHLILFIPALRSQRLVYFCIEWDSETSLCKNVYHIPYLNEEKPKCCVPLGNHNCLVFFPDEFHLVSANQIMSGETNFRKFKLSALKEVSSFFEAPFLLAKLQEMDRATYEEFTDCTILSTTAGNIVICLIDDAERIQFYSLTRFKGLKSICPVKDQSNVINEYNIVLISFARTIELTVDITQIELLMENETIPSLHSVLLKHTLDSSTEEATELMVIAPTKINSRFITELWTTSPVALTNLRYQSPIRKLKTVCTLPEFNVYNRFNIFTFEEIGSSLGTKLFEGFEENKDKKYLIFGTDKFNISRTYFLDILEDNAELIELDDLLCGEEDLTIEIFFPQKDTMVQITEKAVYLESHESNFTVLPKHFFPGWKIEGSSHRFGRVVIWSITEQKFAYIDEIHNVNGEVSFERSINIEEKLRGCPQDTEFHFCDLDENSLLMTTNEGLIRFKWQDVVARTGGPIESTMIYPSKCRSIKQFDSHLCFISEDSKFTLCDMNWKTKSYLDMEYGKKDVRIRKLNSNTGLVFSNQEISIFSLPRSNHAFEFYDLKLPYQNKFNPILDVHVDDSGKKAFVLFSTGLQVFDMSYFTWNYSNYLLRATKQKNKKSLFIKKLNRMLIVNFQSREWDFLKLSDGKILALNPSTLGDSKSDPLLDVAEVPNSSKIVSLVLNFKSYLKLVRLIPYHGKILIEEKSKVEFRGVLYAGIEVSEDGKIYVLQMSPQHDETDLTQEVKIIQFEILNDKKIEPVSSLSYGSDTTNSIKDFRLLGNDHIVIKSSLYERVFFFRDFAQSSQEGRARVIPIKTPLDSNFIKTCPLNREIFVIIYHCIGRSDHISELLFYHKDDMYFKNHSLSFVTSGGSNLLEEAMNAADEEEKCSVSTAEETEQDILLASDDADVSSEMSSDDEDIQESETMRTPSSQASTISYAGADLDIEMDEMDERDAFGPQLPYSIDSVNTEHRQTPSIPLIGGDLDREESMADSEQSETDHLLSDTARYTLARKPYRTIKLDKLAIDVKYDSASRTLCVLTTDGSVLVFSETSNRSEIGSSYDRATINAKDRLYNSGYRIPKHKLHDTPAHIGPRSFNKHGQLV